MTENLKAAVLFVDDEANILKALARLLLDEPYEVLTANSGSEGLKVLEANPQIGLIVSDQRMPEMSGVEFLESSRVINPDAIKILLTGYSDVNATIDAINRGGASRYISKPWKDDELQQIINESLKRYELERENRRLTDLVAKQNEELKVWNSQLEYYVQQQTIDLQNQNRELVRLTERIRNDFKNIIRAFANLIELRDKAVRSHSRNVAEIAIRSARALSLDQREIEIITVASLLHDIGKIGMTDTMLLKSEDDYDQEEQKEYGLHPIRGQIAVDGIDDLRPAGTLIRHHHEWFDGHGFPDGLKGEQIPLGARIIAIADYLDHKSIEAPCHTVDDIQTLLSEAIGSRFDPKLVTTMTASAVEVFKATIPRPDMYEKELKPELLKIGMVVSRDVRSGSGLLLLSKGVTIDQAGIDSLKRQFHFDPSHSGVFVWVKAS